MDKRALKDGFLVAGEAKQPLLSLMFIKIQGRIRMVGTRARAHPIFLDICSYAPHIRRPC